MRYIVLVSLSLIISIASFSQKSLKMKFFDADSMFKAGNTIDAYNTYKEILPQIKKSDTLYNYVVWYYIGTTSQLQKEHLMKCDYTNSIKFGLETLKLIKDNQTLFATEFKEREPWIIKNIVVSYFATGQLSEAKKYKEQLYSRYRERSLPKGIDELFNFDFFKLGNKNIWGYEVYSELPDDRISSSFTKIVYYVYSTNADGSDDQQLCRYHVLMFHQDSKKTEFDYILERQTETPDARISGSYYSYVYKKDIDYKKLRQDIKEIVTKNIEPDTRRVSRK